MDESTTGLRQKTALKQHAVAERLQREIGSGRFARAEVLPGERELSRILKTSRTTLRAALRSLVAGKIVVQRHGYGTVITRTHNSASTAQAAGPTTLIATSSTVDLIRHRGFEATASDRATRTGFPSPDDAWLLRMRAHEAVHEHRRVLLALETPVASERIVVPTRFLAPQEDSESLEAIAVSLGSLSLSRTVQRVRSLPLSAHVARRLGVAEGSAAILVTRMHLLDNGLCCCLTETTLRPEWLDILSEVTGRGLFAMKASSYPTEAAD